MTILSFSLWSILIISVGSQEYPEYYWRDFDGNIPCDALPGGRESNGEITYIGQSYYKRFELLPATIHQRSRVAISTAYTSEIRTENNTKILCTPFPEYFSWIPVNTSMMNLLSACQQVIGGTEIDQILTIGRVNHQGRIVIGKVFPDNLTNRGLWIHANGIPVNYLSYELLTYRCQCPNCATLLNLQIPYN